MSRLRCAFLGSPAFALPALEALVAAGHDVVAVYSQPPRPSGRGHRLAPCPVQARAVELGIPTRHPARLSGQSDEWASFAALDLDVAVVAAYGLILPQAMLSAPRRGCINLHASLLPRWRGAAPIQAAILAGDETSGVTVMQMDRGLDTGDMLLAGGVALDPRETAQTLSARLATLGADLLMRVLDDPPAPVPQPVDGVTTTGKLTRADAMLDWSEDAHALDRRIRAQTPWPGAATLLDGQALKILSARPVAPPGDGAGPPGTVLDDALSVACGGTGAALRLERVQLAGRAATDSAAFLRGRPVPPGTRLGPPG